MTGKIRTFLSNMRTIRIAFFLISLFSFARDANAVITSATVERIDKDHVVISWQDLSPVSAYVSDRPNVGIDESALLVENNRDGRYMTTSTTDKRHYFLLRDAKDGDTVRSAERLLPLEQGSNFRDIGGYASSDGRHVSWGLIYRSGATPLLSDHDVNYVRTLGLHSMIDLRSSEERQLAPTRLINQDIRYIAIDYSLNGFAGEYAGLLTALVPQYRAIFNELLTKKVPLSYNCTAGQDRTGVATALILSSLGVPRQTILSDYHLSTEYRRPQYEMPEVDPAKYPNNPAAALFAKARPMKPPALYDANGRSFLAGLFDSIDAHWGSLENYLQTELGVGPQQVATLRANYLE